MVPKPRMLLIARTMVGVGIAGVLIYGLYSKSSPPGVSALIVLASIVFFILRRRSGAFDRNPHFQEIVKLGSPTPARDLMKALGCFVVMMGLAVSMGVGVKHRVIPDSYIVAGSLVVVILGGA